MAITRTRLILMRIYTLVICMLIAGLDSVSGQTAYGPNNPSSAVGDGTGNGGTISWSNPGNVFTSNNSGASVTDATGTTRYIRATGFGFSIPSPVNILGIQATVERKHTSKVISLLDDWTEGTTKNISAGVQRCLIVVFSMENGDNTRNITAMTYGNQPMTQAVEHNVGNGDGAFCGRLEVWILNDAGISAAANTTIAATFADATGYTSVEYCDRYHAAVYQYVDQVTPVGHTVVSGANGSTNPFQLASDLNVDGGGMALNVAFCGNGNLDVNPAENLSVNQSFTSRVNLCYANPSYRTSGVTVQIADRFITTSPASTLRPSVTFSNSVNRNVMVAVFFNRTPVFDSEVRLIKGGNITGNNLAATNVRWPLTDAVATYGGSMNLWGTTWTLADVNASNFGLALSASLDLGSADIDHITNTVYAVSSLPVKLIDFSGVPLESSVQLNWMTGSESDNDYFEIQRSFDAVNFEVIGKEKGNGNTSVTSSYSYLDLNPLSGVTYYRLRQVDYNGEFEYSPVISLAMDTQSAELLAFPNPAHDLFTLYNMQSEEGKIDIYTEDLKLVKSVSLEKDEEPVVHIEDLPEATYLVFVHEKSGTSVLRMFKVSGTAF